MRRTQREKKKVDPWDFEKQFTGLTGKELGNLAEDMEDVEFGVPSDVPVDKIDEMLSQLHLQLNFRF